MSTTLHHFRRFAAPVAMLVGVLAVYLPPGVWRGEFDLLGADFAMLHQHRIDFAQAQLAHGSLPAWYSRELCGSPFWANVQNFPFIPTRLALLWLPPANLFPASVILSAMLSAVFAFCFARRLGMIEFGAAAAGWTFACSGFFASRVAAGHLPLLEAYPALPLLLWLVDRAVDPPAGRRFDFRLLWLGLATAAVSLAGHPQLWVYALVAALIYAVVRCRGRRSIWVIAAMLAGLGCASFALWPMSLLVGRSTRVLALDRAMNDIAMPYGRLLAAFLPWRDGFPISSPYVASSPLKNLPNPGYFWDTVWYVGLLPWLAVLMLAGRWLMSRLQPDRRAWFVVIMSLAALVLSLPWVQELSPSAGGTFLRSPARLIYLTTFGLSLALGGGVSVLLHRARWNGHSLRWSSICAAGFVVALHCADLSWHDRSFIVPNHLKLPLPPEVERQIIDAVGEGRVGIDLTLPISINRRIDDVSFFDSIMLSRSYRFVMAMKNASPGYNNQFFSAFSFNTSILRACGARLLLTSNERRGLPLERSVEGINIYRIRDAAPRVSFFPNSQVRSASEGEIEQMIRGRQQAMPDQLLIEDAAYTTAASGQPGEAAAITQTRPSSDRIVIDLVAPTAGYVKILEAFDPGWTATVDGAPATIVPANLMFMAVAVAPGTHEIVLSYHTPGRSVGLLLSGLGLVGLFLIAASSSRFDRQPAIAKELLQKRLDPAA